MWLKEYKGNSNKKKKEYKGKDVEIYQNVQDLSQKEVTEVAEKQSQLLSEASTDDTTQT